MKFDMKPLPYAKNALEPIISARTVELHYEKHHRGYLEKLEKMLSDERAAHASLEDLIRTADGDLFNNAAQVWNHDFYWRSLKPGGGGKPEGMLADVLRNAFGSYETFARELAEAANGEFGSGWAWLVRDRYGRLRVQSSDDAENPLQQGYRPLLTIDVWEHAYYIDHQNRRDRYVQGILDQLLNWDFVAENLQLVESEEQEAIDEAERAAEEGAEPAGGEGDREADRRYREAASRFAERSDVHDRARRAAETLPPDSE